VAALGEPSTHKLEHWGMGELDVRHEIVTRRLSRRHLLRRAGQVSLAGLALPLLAACGQATPSIPTAASAPTAPPAAPASAPATGSTQVAPPPTTGTGVLSAQSKVALGKLPTFTPVNGPAPDLPGSPDGLVSPGWIKYPRQHLFQSVKTTPGAGGDVAITVESNNPPWPPLNENVQMQALARAMNIKPNIIYIPFADFDTKWAAIQAGNDLPDLMCTITRPSTPIVPAFLDAKCADLTPYLAGDAVNDYPNLAAIPTRSWKSALVNGKIYGVPIPLRPYFWWFWGHQETVDQLGARYPTSAAEFKDLALRVNKPQDNTWALGSEGGSQYAFSTVNGLWNSVFKAPNYWSVDSKGAFTYLFETDEYRQAMVYAADLVKAGLYHPKSLEYNTLSARGDFRARRMVFRLDGLQSSPYWGGYNAIPMDPPSHITLVPPFSADGVSKPVYYFGRPNFGMTLVKKGSEARVKEMLRILDYIAAPFGSIEHNLIFYGVEGQDYQYDDQDNPVLTDLGHREVGDAQSAWYSLTSPAPTWYSPADPQAPAIYQGYEKLLAPMGVEDASIGTFSQTFASRGTILLEGIGGAAQDIIAGRRSLSDWDQLVRDWQNNGGNQIKSELAASYAQLNAA
jgi:putative aldouronate transport system substrate-binding protein